jgi:hypothetical protein
VEIGNSRGKARKDAEALCTPVIRYFYDVVEFVVVAVLLSSRY